MVDLAACPDIGTKYGQAFLSRAELATVLKPLRRGHGEDATGT
jgi:hypothetical protein